MDNIERMYHHLVQTIRTRFPQHATQPFEVAELYQTILPYRLHRRELGLETNDDYEMTLSELLAGARGYLIVDERMRDALKANLESRNPDPSAFKQFANAMVSLAAPADAEPATPARSSTPRAAPASSLSAPAPAAGPASAAASAAASIESGSAPGGAAPGAPEAPRASRVSAANRSVLPGPDERCRSCGEKLPAGRAITFCPFCGQNVTTVHCPACGSELELGWRFCPTCGRPAGAT